MSQITQLLAHADRITAHAMDLTKQLKRASDQTDMALVAEELDEAVKTLGQIDRQLDRALSLMTQANSAIRASEVLR
jgi:predicted translin family RNA/ssDNA-binding protein